MTLCENVSVPMPVWVRGMCERGGWELCSECVRLCLMFWALGCNGYEFEETASCCSDVCTDTDAHECSRLLPHCTLPVALATF